MLMSSKQYFKSYVLGLKRVMEYLKTSELMIQNIYKSFSIRSLHEIFV